MKVSNRQDERREGTRTNLLDMTARLISRHGLRAITLEQIASEAGYSRGAIYHLYRNKDDLAIAALERIVALWETEVEPLVAACPDPARALCALAARHAVFCRRDVARIAISLRYEFRDSRHPVGAAIARQYEEVHALVRTLVEAAQATATIDPHLPSVMLAEAYVGALEGVVIAANGQPSLDVKLAVRAVAGLLGLPPETAANHPTTGETS